MIQRPTAGAWKYRSAIGVVAGSGTRFAIGTRFAASQTSPTVDATLGRRTRTATPTATASHVAAIAATSMAPDGGVAAWKFVSRAGHTASHR
jgi:hypothetical protein